ncbi:MAG: hypothetical protein JSS23_12340 [Proteobacteria bacterium]|nr:hypothetical protein [Pseudomonadota bacterium]
MGFADSFSAVAGTILDAKRLKAQREEADWRKKQIAKEAEDAIGREERQQAFQKQMLADRMAGDVARDKQQRLWKMEDDFQGIIDRSQDRSLKEKLINAQVDAANRSYRPAEPKPAPPKPQTPFEHELANIESYDQAQKRAVAAAIEALGSGDMTRILPTQERMAQLSRMNPANQPAPTPMASVERPYVPPGVDPQATDMRGTAKYQVPLAALEQDLAQSAMMRPGQAQGAGDSNAQALAWARANPNDPRAAMILKKLGMQ